MGGDRRGRDPRTVVQPESTAVAPAAGSLARQRGQRKIRPSGSSPRREVRPHEGFGHRTSVGIFGLLVRPAMLSAPRPGRRRHDDAVRWHHEFPVLPASSSHRRLTAPRANSAHGMHEADRCSSPRTDCYARANILYRNGDCISRPRLPQAQTGEESRSVETIDCKLGTIRPAFRHRLCCPPNLLSTNNDDSLVLCMVYRIYKTLPAGLGAREGIPRSRSSGQVISPGREDGG